MNRIADQDLGGDAIMRGRVLGGSGDVGIGFKPDPTETAALILPGHIGYVAANIHRIGFKPDSKYHPILIPNPIHI